MIRNILIVTFILITCGRTQAQSTDSSKPYNLICDYLSNPLGVDNKHPRLSWKIGDSRTSSYQLIVGKDSLNVLKGEGDMFVGELINSDNTLIEYDGKELEPFTRYFWMVKSWDQNNKVSQSDVTWFETGMMDKVNWQGAWISDKKDIEYKPAPYFRKTFETKKEIKSARAYIAVAGLYELYINGNKVGNHRLDPMYTRFDRRNMYVTYDVTQYLPEGKNAIGILLGNGWYNHQSKAVWNFDKASWRNRPTFCLDLRITYTDGSVETITSDRDWKTSSGGLIFNSIYTAEHYDARLEQKGWNTKQFDDSGWEQVIYRSPPSANIVSQQLQPIRNVESITPQNINKISETCYVSDFGRNISGVTHVRISGKEGSILKLKHGERLYPNGLVDISNIDVYYTPEGNKDPFQTDIITLSGENDDFMPKFNYKGFRYVEVNSSEPINIDKDNITAYFMHSDVTPKGFINSSDSLINKLWRATNNSYLSNLMGYPTDCPQREKNGWTGDGHLAIETALYNFDAITIYEKWLADHRDEQQSNGVLPDIIPTGGWGYGTKNGLDWTSTIAIIPWEIYMFYGDSKLLSDCYENIKSYVNYVDKKSPDGLTSWGRGDWVPVKSKSNLELTSSVYFYVDTKILANAAKLFDRQDDYIYYSSLAEKIKLAINEKYLNRETGIYATGTQTELSVPLKWGVVPEDVIAKVTYNLVKKVEEANFHLDVGVLGAKAILNALSENGYPDIAYRVATQDTYPSWGWWIVNGATTLLENWDTNATKDISDNHMMFGEIGAWFFKGLGGIFPDSENPGFKHIILRPYFTKKLEYFEAKHDSPHGTIISKWIWNKDKTELTYTIQVPPNCIASLFLPDNIEGEKVIKMEAGEYVFNLSEEKETKQRGIR